MTREEREILQDIIKSIRETHTVIHNLSAIASAAINPDPAKSEPVRQGLLKGLEAAQHSVGAAQKKLTNLPVLPPKP